MVLQGGNENLARQFEKALLELASERHRPLDERCDLIEQRVVHDRRTAQRDSELLGSLSDALASLVEIGEHPSALAKHANVSTRAGDSQRSRSMETVPTREAITGYAEDGRRHDFPAEEQQHPVDWSHEFGLATAPAHPFRNR